jgi:hypothetical protein
MRLLFNVICLIAAGLLLISAVGATSAADAWPNETRNNLLGVAFLAAVCGATNYFWKRK